MHVQLIQDHFLKMSRECMFLGSLSRHNKELERWTLKRSARHSCSRVIALRQISVTALFYLEDRRKIHLRGVRARQSKDTRRRTPQCVGCGEGGWGGREREPARGRALALASLFICLSLPGPVLCKLGQPGVLFVLPEGLTLVLGPSFILFSRAFPSLSFSHCHFGLLFPILPT